MASLFKVSAKLLFALGLAASSMQGALAHTYFSSIYLGDQALAEGDCMRSHPQLDYDSPIPLVTDAAMTCGFRPEGEYNKPANRKCPIAAGGKIGLQWYHQSASASDNIVDATHVGPLMVYLAKSESGSGNVWFKIYEDGYTNGQWAVDKLIANRGRVDVTIPADIEPGNYLLRGEIIALHGANALNGVQPYVGCAELTISGNGKASPAGVAIPGIYKQTDAGMLFDLYNGYSSYPIPGPAVYKSGSSPSTPSKATSAPVVPTPAAPSATTRPVSTSAPSTPSTPSANVPVASEGNIQVGLNGGSNVWWIGAIVSSGSETTVKVEMMDSGSIKNWVAMADQSYAYTYNSPSKVVTPISLRVTSSSGKQVVLTNIFTSFSTGNKLLDTGRSYSGSAPAATAAPAATTKPVSTSAPAATAKPVSTSAPAATSKPTSAATSAPSTGDAKITLHSGASEWWFALTVNADVSKVEIKDSAAFTSYVSMTANNWGGPVVYTLPTSGAALVAPISARITSKSGKVVTATIDSISANKEFALGSL